MRRVRAEQPRPEASLPDVVSAAFTVVIAAALVIVVILCGTLGWVLLGAQPRIAELRHGVDAVRDSQQAMLDQETGARAYLLIGTQQFLEPYDEGRHALDVANAQLDTLVKAEPSLADRLVAARVAADRWQQQWATRAVSSRTSLTDSDGMLDTHRTVPFLDDGKDLFDAYRAASQALQTAASSLLAHVVRIQDTVLGATAGVELLVGLAAVGLAARRRRLLTRDVVHPVDALVAYVDRVRQGDLSTEAAPTTSGPRELRRLGRGVVAMTASLAHELENSRERGDELDRQADKLRMVLDLAREIAGSLSLRYILDAVAHAGQQITGSERVTLWLTEEDQRLTQVFDSTLGKDVAPQSRRLSLGEGLVGRAAKYGRAMDQDRAGLHAGAPAEHVLAVPMIVGARVIGVVECRHTDELSIDEESLAILETLAVHAATALEAARLHDQTTQLASVDALTRLANRRRLDDDLEAEVERSGRYGRPLSFVMIDLDHFKAVNDTYGHQRADEVLQEVSSVIESALRTSDTAYRYGGEELCVVVRETDLADAARLAERLRAQISARFRAPGDPTVTASFGVAQLSAEHGSAEALIRAADAALYRAKRGGRDRVELAETGQRVEESPAPVV